MTVQTFIERAIEGGWKGVSWDGMNLRPGTNDIFSMLLDPFAWQAVGKVEGWKECPADLHPEQCGLNHYAGWLWKMRSMIDALAEGKTIEQYLETL